MEIAENRHRRKDRRGAQKRVRIIKYRLARIVGGECVLRYDNETGKGDHRHVGKTDAAYAFSSYEKLLADFWSDVETWRQRR